MVTIDFCPVFFRICVWTDVPCKLWSQLSLSVIYQYATIYNAADEGFIESMILYRSDEVFSSLHVAILPPSNSILYKVYFFLKM